MNDPHRAARFLQDFVTNPCWPMLLQELAEMERREMVKLQSESRGGNMAAVNHQGGVLDGIQRVCMRLRNMESEARETMKRASESPA